MSIVSSLDPSITVGRPIVYVMHDVFGSNILAVGISFDNNSVLGMTNCFLNLAQNKVEYCARYGITISEDMWPSCYLPGRILVDRGAEYRSYEAKRIFRELNIHRELAPAGSGSMKGLVEQWFHQMHSSQNPSLEKHGLIEKRYDSKHHKEACLTIDDFTVMLINFVIHHNCSVLSDYPLTADMISKRVFLNMVAKNMEPQNRFPIFYSIISVSCFHRVQNTIAVESAATTYSISTKMIMNFLLTCIMHTLNVLSFLCVLIHVM